MKKSLFLFVIAVIFFNSFTFANGYFFNFKLPVPFLLVITLAIIFSILPWVFSEKRETTKKITSNAKSFRKIIVLSVISIIFMITSLCLSTFATMFVPGSKEHNYVMYNICLPAMKSHYASKNSAHVPNIYDLHSKCEQNVWAGRDPLQGFE